MRSSPGDAWVLPKGHIESGERPEETARREVREEAGVEAAPVALLGEDRYERLGEEAHVAYFLMRFEQRAHDGTARPGMAFGGVGPGPAHVRCGSEPRRARRADAREGEPMNTAEIALEHLVTGALALAVVLLPVFGIDAVACTLQSGTAAVAMLGIA